MHIFLCQKQLKRKELLSHALGLLQIVDVTFNNVTTKLKNDTGYTLTEADFISGDGNGTGTDVSAWGMGWTVGVN